MKRTLNNCRLVTKYGKPNQYNGVCEGFATSSTNDEPCDICKKCKSHYLYEDAEPPDMMYKAVLRCSSCGAAINETENKTAKELVDNHIMISMTSVFAGDCPKGCRPTFSDCNMRTSITYENDKGKRFTFEEIKATVTNERSDTE